MSCGPLSWADSRFLSARKIFKGSPERSAGTGSHREHEPRATLGVTGFLVLDIQDGLRSRSAMQLRLRLRLCFSFSQGRRFVGGTCTFHQRPVEEDDGLAPIDELQLYPIR